jgi:hypothetical protein
MPGAIKYMANTETLTDKLVTVRTFEWDELTAEDMSLWPKGLRGVPIDVLPLQLPGSRGYGKTHEILEEKDAFSSPFVSV